MGGEPTGTDIEGEEPDIEPVVETDEATITDDAELERTLGLAGGLVIGIGTMMGPASSSSRGWPARKSGQPRRCRGVICCWSHCRRRN